MKLEKLLETEKNYQSIRPLNICGVPFLGLGHKYGVDLLNLKSRQLKKVELDNIIGFGSWNKSKFKDILLLEEPRGECFKLEKEIYLIASHSFVGVIKVPLSNFYTSGNRNVLHLDSKNSGHFVFQFGDQFRNPMRLAVDSDKLYVSSENNLFVYNKNLLFEKSSDLTKYGLMKKNEPIFSFDEGTVSSMLVYDSNIYLKSTFGEVVSLNLNNFNEGKTLGDITTLGPKSKNGRIKRGDLKKLDDSHLVYSTSSYLFSLDLNSKERKLVLSEDSNILDYSYQNNTQKLIVLTEQSLSIYVQNNFGNFNKIGCLEYGHEKISAMGAK